MNSPSDNNFAAFDSGLGQVSFITTTLRSNFTASNSAVNGINPIPNQFTGAEGAVRGVEMQITITFATPFLVGATDHDFFRPEVNLGNAGDFLWLLAPKPDPRPRHVIANDLQSWIRNDGPGTLAPDWERIGTAVTNQGPFNASFSLIGTTIPEPSTFVLFALGFVAIALRLKRSAA